MDYMPCIQEYRDKLAPESLVDLLTVVPAAAWQVAVLSQVTAQVKIDLVRSILAEYGISPIFNPMYLAYTEEMVYVRTTYHPSVWPWYVDYTREMKIVCDKWAGRGLDKDVLWHIAYHLRMYEAEGYLFPP